MIELKHLRKAYPGLVLLEDVNVTIHRGDVIAVIGPSGMGKSTLIRCINQLDKPTSGSVLYDGRDLTDPRQYDANTRRKIGMVFQSFNLFSHMTVLENVTYVPIHKQKLSGQEAYDKALRYLKLVGMAEKIYAYPSQLSGGQKQRVAIARTLATEPELLLLDEPMSALDPTMVSEVEAVIRQIARQGVTMMIVTHSMNLARYVANRVFYIDQGGIYEEGTPEQIFEHPRRERTRAFLEQSRHLTIRIDSPDHDLYASINEIESFTLSYHVPRSLALHIRLHFEEICCQHLLPHLGTSPKLRVDIEYVEKLSSARMCIRYNGDRHDVFENADFLSLPLIQGYSENVQYFFCPEEEFSNRLELNVL